MDSQVLLEFGCQVVDKVGTDDHMIMVGRSGTLLLVQYASLPPNAKEEAVLIYFS